MPKYLAYGPDNVDTLITTTTNFWLQNQAEDQVFTATPFWQELYKNKKSADGGTSILIPLMYEQNSTATWYSGYDILDTTPTEGFTTAQALWRNLAVSITISGDEKAKNATKEKIIDLIDAKTNQATLSLINQLASSLFATVQNTNAIQSMVTMIDTTSTIQNINSSTNSWWQATVTASGSFAAQGLTDMRNLWTTINKYYPQYQPDVIVTTETIYNYYEGALLPQLRYTTNEAADASYETLKFKTCKIFYDAQCNSGVLYMFSTKNLFIVVNSNSDMKKTEFVKPANQDAQVAQIIIRLQLCTNARRKLGKLTGITQ